MRKKNLVRTYTYVRYEILFPENLPHAKSKWSKSQNVWCKLQWTDVKYGPGIQLPSKNHLQLRKGNARNQRERVQETDHGSYSSKDHNFSKP